MQEYHSPLQLSHSYAAYERTAVASMLIDGNLTSIHKKATKSKVQGVLGNVGCVKKLVATKKDYYKIKGTEGMDIVDLKKRYRR